jgi:hypothetical protein
VYSGSVGVGGTAIGLGVVAGAAVTGNLPTTGFASIIWALIAVALIFGGLLLVRLAALRRARAELEATHVHDARTQGRNAALGIDHRNDDLGCERVD